MMFAADLAWAADLMRAKYGSSGEPRARQHAEALRCVGRHRAASLWKEIAEALQAGPAPLGDAQPAT